MKAEKIRPLVQTGATRLASLIQVPTAIDNGFKDFESYAWWGVFGPAGLPKPITDKFREALAESLREPAVRKQLEENLQSTMLLGGPDEERQFLEKQMALWGPVVTENNIKGE